MGLFSDGNKKLQALFQEINTTPKKYVTWLLITISVIEIVLVLKGQRAGDFWEHTAVLKELIRAPLHPSHPIILSDLPHAFFSPYLVALGLIGNIIKTSPVTLLSVAAIVNLFLWLYGMFLLVRTFYPEKAWSIYFYLLLLHLFAWGPLPWIYSSFFHFSTLHYVLSYPSTFAVALGFISTYLFARTFEATRYRIVFLVVIIVLNTVTLITHPTSFLLTISLISVLAFKRIRQYTALTVTLGAVGLLTPLILVNLWPYYSFWDLFLSASSGSQFHSDSRVLYHHVLIRIAPALLVFFLISKEDLTFRNDAILLFIMLLVIYLYGLLSGQTGFGRVISFMVLALHLLIAYRLSTPNNLRGKDSLVLLLLMVSCLPFMFSAVKTTYNDITFSKNDFYRDYEFLGKHLDYDDVVITDRGSLRLIPAFGGRVTASVFPPYWIKDNEERMNDLAVFFSETTDAPVRNSILMKYHADFVLLDKRHVFLKDTLIQTLDLDLEYQNSRFILLKVKAPRNAAGE
jgi:hypothetical protein